MRRLSAEVLFAVRVLGDSRREGIAVLVGGRFIGPACGFSQFLAFSRPHGSDQSAGLFLVFFGGAVRADPACVEVVDLVCLLNVGAVCHGQVLGGLHTVMVPVVSRLCGAGVDACEERDGAPGRGALSPAADVQDIDQRIVVGCVESCGALVDAVVQGQCEGVVPWILDSAVLAYEELGVLREAMCGIGRGSEENLESCARHIRVVIAPEEAGLAVLREDRAGGFRQCVQLHVISFPAMFMASSRGTVGISPDCLLWRDRGAGLILAGAVASFPRSATGTRRAWGGACSPPWGSLLSIVAACGRRTGARLVLKECAL